MAKLIRVYNSLVMSDDKYETMMNQWEGNSRGFKTCCKIVEDYGRKFLQVPYDSGYDSVYVDLEDLQEALKEEKL